MDPEYNTVKIMKYSNRKYIKKQKEKDQNLVALDRTPHQVLAKLSSFGFVLAEKELIIITRSSFKEKKEYQCNSLINKCASATSKTYTYNICI